MIYKNTDLVISLYYSTTIVFNPVKEKRLERSKEQNPLVTTFLLHYYKVVTTIIHHTTETDLLINELQRTGHVVSIIIQKLKK